MGSANESNDGGATCWLPPSFATGMPIHDLPCMLLRADGGIKKSISPGTKSADIFWILELAPDDPVVGEDDPVDGVGDPVDAPDDPVDEVDEGATIRNVACPSPFFRLYDPFPAIAAIGTGTRTVE